MKKTYYLFFICIISVMSAQLPDISFNGSNLWSTSAGISFDPAANQSQIIGSGNNYVKTTLEATLPSNTGDFYFYADIYLENINFNPENIRNPTMVVRDASNSVIYRFNIEESLQNNWFKGGIKISGYTASTIKFEIGINSTTGTMKVKNPVLSATPPSFNYEFPFTVPSNTDTVLNVDTSQKHNFKNDILSTNSHFLYASYQWGSNNISNALNSYFPMSNFRFPGGTVGNYYNYNTDTFFVNSNTPANLVNFANSGYTFKYNNYKTQVQNLGGSATLMLNMITPTPSQTLAEYQSRINSGLNVKWLELGNEMYLSGNQIGNVTGISSYISHTQNVASLIKSYNANAKVAVCVDKDGFAPGSWNYTLSQNQNYFDAATLHNYNSTGIYFYNKYASYAMLKMYKISMNRFLQYKNLFPAKPLLLTEWGILSEVEEPYFLSVLGVADGFLAIEKASEMNIVHQAGLHMLYKNDQNSEATLMYYGADNQLKLTSRGKMYSKLFEIFKDSEVYNAETTGADLETDLKAVYAKLVKKGDEYKVFAVNKLPVPSSFTLIIDGQNYTGSYIREAYTENMSIPTPEINASSNSWNPVTQTGSITLPASSISIITLTSANFLQVQNSTAGTKNSIYPNPAKNTVYIKDGIKADERLKIKDSSGRDVTYLVKVYDESIDVSALSEGIYFISRSNHINQTITDKLIIKKF